MYRDATAAEMDGEDDEAAAFREEARELEQRIEERMADIPADNEGRCLTCGRTGVVIGNGTYGGPGRKQRQVVLVI